MKTILWPILALMCGFIIAAAIHQGFKGRHADPELEARARTSLPKDVVLKTAARTQLHVTAIIDSADKPSAIINSKVVHEGNTVGDATVIKIEDGWVHFEKRGKKWAQGIEQPAADNPK